METAKQIADSNLDNKIAKIRTFTKVSTNTIPTNNFNNDFNIAYNTAYNKEISLAKTNLDEFLQKYGIKKIGNLNINEIKKKIDSLKYKEISFVEQHNKINYFKNTNLKNTNIKAALILNNLTNNLGETSKKLSELTIALGVISGVITAELTIAGFFTFGIATLFPLFLF